MQVIRRHVASWFLFMVVGIPAFLLAVPANFALVEYAGVPKEIAYAAVLAGQLTINFFMCRWLVFKKESASKWYHDFALFFWGNLFLRFLDWLVYLLLVHRLGVYYLVAQVLNVMVFSVVKFLFSKKVLS